MLDVGPFVGGRVLECDDGARGQIVDVEAGQQIVNELRKARVVAHDEQRLDRSACAAMTSTMLGGLGEVQPPLERNRVAGVVHAAATSCAVCSVRVAGLARIKSGRS